MRILLAASTGMFAINVDFFAMQTTLPRMAVDLDTTVTTLQWVISGYMLALASFLIVGGRLADLLGRRTFLIIGAAIFGLASLGGGAASSAEVVITMRVVQGIGAAILFPVSLAVVTNAFPADKTQRAVGLVFGIAAIGQALGPLIGGALTEWITWRWVLWVNIPISVALIALTVSSVEESRDETVPRSIDWVGLVLVVASIATFTYGIDRAGDLGWGSAQVIGLILIGLVGLFVFVVVESKVRFPLLDLTLFAIRKFSLITAAGAVGNMAIVTTIFLSMIFLQNVEDLSALQAGLVFLAFSLPLTAIDQVAGRLERFPAGAVMATALAVGGLGTIGMALSNNLALFAFFSAFSGIGLGLSWAFSSVVTQDAVPAEKAGEASGTVLTVLIGCGGVAIAVAAALVDTGTGATQLEDALDTVLFGFGALAAVAAPIVALVSRRIEPSPHVEPLDSRGS